MGCHTLFVVSTAPYFLDKLVLIDVVALPATEEFAPESVLVGLLFRCGLPVVPWLLNRPMWFC